MFWTIVPGEQSKKCSGSRSARRPTARVLRLCEHEQFGYQEVAGLAIALATFPEARRGQLVTAG